MSSCTVVVVEVARQDAFEMANDSKPLEPSLKVTAVVRNKTTKLVRTNIQEGQG
jgi:hypothetical protein